MPAYTLGGQALCIDSLPTYAVTPTSGTLGSGQEYIQKEPVSGPDWMPLLYLHGASGDETSMNNGIWPEKLSDYLASHGFTVISGDVGGILTWDNSLFRTGMAELVTYARTLGLDDDTYGLIAPSMGASNAMAWASDNMSEVQCAVLATPCCDLQDIVDNNRSGLGTTITNAHGGVAGWNAARPNSDPAVLAANGDLDGFSAQMVYGTSDTIVIPQTVLDLAADIGDTVELISVAGDHGPANINTDGYRMAEFIIRNYPPALAYRTVFTV